MFRDAAFGVIDRQQDARHTDVTSDQARPIATHRSTDVDTGRVATIGDLPPCG